MVIATALHGFNDLGRLVTLLYFLETDLIYNYLHHDFPEINKNLT